MESVRSQLLSLWSELNPADPLHDARGKRRDLDAEGVVDTVLNSYREWRPPEKHSERLEIFAPSLHHRVQVRIRQGDPGELDVAMPPYDRWSLEILHLSLYVDRIWIPDPAEIVARALDDVIRPRLAVHDFLADPNEAYHALAALAPLEPLVEAGIVSYYPPLRLYETTVSHEMFGKSRDFSDEELATGWPDLFVEEGLVYTDILGASYAALSRDEFDAMGRCAQELRERAGLLDARVVAALPTLKLPYFDKISPELLVAVRQNESAFDDFRNLLREVARILPGGADSPQFAKEAQRIEQDMLSPAIKKLLDEVRGITVVKDTMAGVGIDFAAGALAGFVLTGTAPLALASGAITAVSKAIVKLVAKRSGTRAAGSVVLAFYTGRTPRHGLLPSLGFSRYR